MDSTLRSNLSVGMPLDLLTIRRNEYRVATRERIEPGDPAFAAMSEAWSKALRDGFADLPSFPELHPAGAEARARHASPAGIGRAAIVARISGG